MEITSLPQRPTWRHPLRCLNNPRHVKSWTKRLVDPWDSETRPDNEWDMVERPQSIKDQPGVWWLRQRVEWYHLRRRRRISAGRWSVHHFQCHESASADLAAQYMTIPISGNMVCHAYLINLSQFPKELRCLGTSEMFSQTAEFARFRRILWN